MISNYVTIKYDRDPIMYSASQVSKGFSGQQSYAVGVNNVVNGINNRVVWGNMMKNSNYEILSQRLPYIDGKIPDEAIRLEVARFVEQHQYLINNNKWDDFYNTATKLYASEAECIYRYKFMVSEFQKLFKKCDVDDLKHLTYIPSFYLCDQFLYEFEIPRNIRNVREDAFLLCPNLNKIKWDCEQPTLSTPGHTVYLLPSIDTMEDLYGALATPKLIIDFLDVNYDNDWVNRLKKYLKEAKKKNKNVHGTKIFIKFKDKNKEIRIV